MSRIRQYYERELTALREEGRLFAERFPKLAPFLGQGIKDPEIERLLEGFAFISGKLWAKIDDAYPELAEQFLSILAPTYCSITPSATILQFQPNPALGQKAKLIPRGTEIISTHQGEKYPLVSSYDLWVNPLELCSFQKKVKQGLTHCTLGFKALYGTTSHTLERPFRFYLQGDLRETYALAFLLKRHLKGVYFQVGKLRQRLDEAQFKTLGFGATESLIPFEEEDYQSFGLLADYFNFHEKYLCLELTGVDLKQLPSTKTFEIELVLAFDERDLLSIQAEHFQLHAVPAVNVFEASAEPILHRGEKVTYPLRVDGRRDLAIKKVIRVNGFGEIQKTHFKYQAAREFPVQAQDLHRYEAHFQESILHDHPNLFLELWSPKPLSETEIISTDVWAYQPHAFLKVNGIHLLRAEKSTLGLEFTNLIPFTLPIYPPLALEVLWQLIAHLAFKFKNLAEVETLKEMVLAYDFAGLSPGRSQGLGKKIAASFLSLHTHTAQLFRRGELFYGKHSILSLQEDSFLNWGEIDLLGGILAEILKEHAPFNSFHTLEIKGVLSGTTLSWT